MVTLASPIIRVAASTVSAIEYEIANPTASNVGDQVVELDVDYSVTANAATDAYQVLSDGKLLFKTDLPATTTQPVNVLSVVCNQFPVTSPVEVTQDTDTFTMSNEYYTVTLRKTMVLPGSPLTPIDTIVPATGTVQLTGNRHFANAWGYVDPYFPDTTRPVPTGYTFEVIESGPLLVRVKATYTFTHDNFSSGGDLLWPAGSGFASETIELRAGVNAVFFENESDYGWISGLSIDNLTVNQIRYRGHTSTSIANGYVIDEDAVQEQYNDSVSHKARTATRDVSGEVQDFPNILPWGPFASNTGRFATVRNTAGTGQYVSIITGKPGRAIGTAATGIRPYVFVAATRLIYTAVGRAADGTISTTTRYCFAVSIGDEPFPAINSTTVPEPQLIQNQQLNFTLSKLANWKPASTSETFYSNSLWLSEAQQDSLLTRIAADSAYAASLVARDSTVSGLIAYIEDPTFVRATNLYNAVVSTYNGMLEGYWFKNGYLEYDYGYIQASTLYADYLLRIPLLMQDTNLTANQKANLYKIMLVFGLVLADEDFVPLNGGEQFTFGTANMPLQYTNQMDALHLLLLGNPTISAYFNSTDFAARVTSRFNAYVSSYGSSLGTPHYTYPGVVPALFLMQQGNIAGLVDFASTSARLENFANFVMSFVTPPDSRFGDLRKMISLGDGSLEGSATYGQLGTIFAGANPTLSAKLMDVWDSMGSPHDGFYFSTVFAIDDQLPTASMALTDAHYPDYMSVLRSGFGTTNESAVWFLHGDWYYDHRHYDTGATYFYLLGKPIALSFSCFYDPYAPGALMCNGLALQSDVSWDGTGSTLPSLSLGDTLFPMTSVTPSLTGSRPSVAAAFTIATGTTWTRTVTLNRESVTRPVVIINDAFTGTSASVGKILNLNLMASGAVVTPSGNVTPTVTMNTATTNSKTALSSGWATFEFTGQWNVNVILMVYNAASADYQLGAFKHDFSPSTETAQYLAAVGSAYQETQYQFRLWSTGDSKFVLVPWRSTDSKPTVTTSGTDVLVNGVTVT